MGGAFAAVRTIPHWFNQFLYEVDKSYGELSDTLPYNEVVFVWAKMINETKKNAKNIITPEEFSKRKDYMEKIATDLLLTVIKAKKLFKEIDDQPELSEKQKTIRKQLYFMIRNFVINRILE